MDADALMEAVARGIFPADYDAMKYEASTYVDKPNGQSALVEVKAMQSSARAALAAVVTAAGLDAAAIMDSAFILAPVGPSEEDTPGQKNDRRTAALLRALADVAEAQR